VGVQYHEKGQFQSNPIARGYNLNKKPHSNSAAYTLKILVTHRASCFTPLLFRKRSLTVASELHTIVNALRYKTVVLQY